VVSNWLIGSAVKLFLADDYPYTITKATCAPLPGKTPTLAYQTSKTNVSATINSSPTVWNAAIAKAPFEIYVRADTAYWQGYKSGILNNSCCYLSGRTVLNRVVLMIGSGIS